MLVFYGVVRGCRVVDLYLTATRVAGRYFESTFGWNNEKSIGSHEVNIVDSLSMGIDILDMGQI